ncbi:hypothetical protein GCM10009548_70000 [Streptomyces malaysiensis subsp. malaysiensis]
MPCGVAVPTADRTDHDILTVSRGKDRRRFKDVSGDQPQRRVGRGQPGGIADDGQDIMTTVEGLAEDTAADHPGGAEKSDPCHLYHFSRR